MNPSSPSAAGSPIVSQPLPPHVIPLVPVSPGSPYRRESEHTLGTFPLGGDRTGHPQMLRVRTLGGFQVLLSDASGGGEPVWANEQSRKLLKRLVAAPGYQLTTDALMDYLWPNSDLESGPVLLRGALSKLRRALEPTGPAYNRSSYLAADRQSVRLVVRRPSERNRGIWLDSAAFEQLAEAALAALARHEGEDGLALAHAALALYRGPFLPFDCYDDWSRAARERYQRLRAMLVRRAALCALALHRFDDALQLLGPLTDDAPDDEEAIALSMVASVGARRRVEALRIYQALCTHLQQTLAVVPDPVLAELDAAIRRGTSVDELLARLC